MIRYIAASCRGSDTNTTAAAADNDDDDDASQCDVIATRPEHLLLRSMDSCPATRFLLFFYHYDRHSHKHGNDFCCGSVI